MKLGEQLERSQLPRRLLGAILAVLVPGAGHVVIGYTRVGWIIAGVTLGVGAGFVGSARACWMTPLAIFGGLYVFGTIASLVSIFALPPGPRLKDGLRALWPVLVLFLVFRGAAYAMQTWALAGDFAVDASMAPSIVRGDLVLSGLDPSDLRANDVVVVEHPIGSGRRYLRRVVSQDAEVIALQGDAADPAAEALSSVPRAELRGRALFVFAAARGTNGIGRVWKPLR